MQPNDIVLRSASVCRWLVVRGAPCAAVVEKQMSWLWFWKEKTPKELIREHQRSIRRATTELQRERVKLEAQEKKLINDIKKDAKNGQIVCTLSRLSSLKMY